MLAALISAAAMEWLLPVPTVAATASVATKNIITMGIPMGWKAMDTQTEMVLSLLQTERQVKSAPLESIQTPSSFAMQAIETREVTVPS